MCYINISYKGDLWSGDWHSIVSQSSNCAKGSNYSPKVAVKMLSFNDLQYKTPALKIVMTELYADTFEWLAKTNLQKHPPPPYNPPQLVFALLGSLFSDLFSAWSLLSKNGSSFYNDSFTTQLKLSHIPDYLTPLQSVAGPYLDLHLVKNAGPACNVA